MAILAPPGVKEAILSLGNNYFHLGLSLNQPMWLGIGLIICGLITIGCGEWLKRISRTDNLFLLFRHRSHPPFLAHITSADLTGDVAESEIREVNCDQAFFFSNGSAELKSAVHFQVQKLSELIALRTAFPKAPVGYYGLAHVPLQFLAGKELQMHAEVRLFENNRQSGVWRELQKNGPELGAYTTLIAQPSNARCAAVAISISYEIQAVDVQEVLKEAFEYIRIGLPSPHLDAITSYDQISRISGQFRRALDDLHARLPSDGRVHVFYAGPAPLGFSLGRQISPTIHNRVVVHNYIPHSRPKYIWGLDLASNLPCWNDGGDLNV